MSLKIELINYYDDLTERQKRILEEKNGFIVYYNYSDYFKKYELTNEQAGIIMLALMHYARYHGRESLPPDLEKALEENIVMLIIFNILMEREAKATKEWINKRGSSKSKSKKSVSVSTPIGIVKLKGNPENMPSEADFTDIVENHTADIESFIEAGNTNGWEIPWEDIIEEL